MQARVLSISRFIAEYSSTLMGSGVHTSRVIRNSKRIGDSFGLDIKIGIFQKTIVLTIIDSENNITHSEVVDITSHPISFEFNAELSALSWEAYDKHLSLEELKEKYNQIVHAPRMNPLFVLILVGFANASFCKLFGGDWVSIGIVFSATCTGFFIKQRLIANKVNHFIVCVVTAFIASLCASISFLFDTTSEVALTTSVLFLVPGVPLINGVIDIVEGYILTGFSRLTEAALLVTCIGVGMSVTMFLVKDNLL